MKTVKKQKKGPPKVQILGDLQDVKIRISSRNKKKTIVVFHDGEADSFYLEIDGKFQQILQNDFGQLEKEYKLILFSFFPSRKKVEPVTEVMPEEQASETALTGEPEKKEKKKTEKKHEYISLFRYFAIVQGQGHKMLCPYGTAGHKILCPYSHSIVAGGLELMS